MRRVQKPESEHRSNVEKNKGENGGEVTVAVLDEASKDGVAADM
jgi:hypothetical protein